MSVIWSLHLNTTHFCISKYIYVARCKQTQADFTHPLSWWFTWHWALSSGTSSWLGKYHVLAWPYSFYIWLSLLLATPRVSMGFLFIYGCLQERKKLQCERKYLWYMVVEWLDAPSDIWVALQWGELEPHFMEAINTRASLLLLIPICGYIVG